MISFWTNAVGMTDLVAPDHEVAAQQFSEAISPKVILIWATNHVIHSSSAGTADLGIMQTLPYIIFYQAPPKVATK